MLEKIVFEAISSLADFVKCHESVFLYMLAKKTNAMRQKEKGYGVTRFTELHRTLHKNFLIWRCQKKDILNR